MFLYIYLLYNVQNGAFSCTLRFAVRSCQALFDKGSLALFMAFCVPLMAANKKGNEQGILQCNLFCPFLHFQFMSSDTFILLMC